METHQLPGMNQVLSNGVVLANVFQFLPLQDLKSLRLVSISWRDVAAPIFRRRTTVTLRGDEAMSRFLESFVKTPARLVPFVNYTFNELIFDAESEAVTETFLERFGPSVESLQLNEVILVGLQVVRDILFNFTPKLRDISIKDCKFYETYQSGGGSGTGYEEIAQLDEDVQVNKNLSSFRYVEGDREEEDADEVDFPISWEEIFIAYPNIRGLELNEMVSKQTELMLKIMKSRKLKDPNCLQLQKLDIFNGLVDLEIPPDAVDLLISLQLSLRELSIDFGDGVSCKDVARLLHQQRNAEKLTLCGTSDGLTMTGFPFEVQFNNLHYLEMEDTISDSMKFLGFMPNLSTLVLNHVPVEPPINSANNVIVRTDTRFIVMPLQTKLTTLQINYEISSDDVKKLVSWFPGVVTAELYLDNEGFRTVCVGWRNLRELEVLGGQLTTEGITNLTTESPGIYQLQLQGSTCAPVEEYNSKNTRLKNPRQFIMTFKNKSTGNDGSVDGL